MPTAHARRTDPADRLAVAHDRLVAAVEELTTGEAWGRMLAVAARFPTYSANNILLIGVQAPDATRVCGIRGWNALGRRVRKGEKGIAILAPCLYRVKPGDVPGSVDRPAADARDRSEGTGREAARQLRGFRIVHVFDVAATDGEPLPDCGPQLLSGEAPRQLISRLVDGIQADGYVVERGHCIGGANGVTDFAARTVRVRDDVPDAQIAKTLSHEMGHIRADHEPRLLAEYRSSLGCRAQAEVEAESIAFLVTHAAGLDTDAYSVPYLAGWSGGDATLLRDAASRAIGTARGIVTDLSLDRPAIDLEAPLPEHDRAPCAPGPLPAERDWPSPC